MALVARRGSRILPGRRFPTFQPYTPPRPPSGSYDPVLDAQRAASQRGLIDVRQDTGLAGTRAAEDYGLGVEDLNRQFSRGSSDLDTSLSRGTEDYSRQIADLQRSYGQLQRRQAEGARASGVLSGGLALRAAQIRAANQAHDRAPIDTGYQRLQQDIGTQRQRLTEDRDLGIGRLGLDYGRGVTDRTTGLSRAEREDAFFGQDIEAQKAFQAGQAGWAPPGRGEPGGMPRNQFTDPKTGQQYRVIVSNGWRYTVDPSGRVLSKKRRR